MDSTLLIGIAVVVLGVGAGAFLMFGQHANSLAGTAATTGTLPAPSDTPASKLTTSSAGVGKVARGDDVRIRWYQRVRAAFMLLLITLGIGTAIGAVVGAAALAASVLMG